MRLVSSDGSHDLHGRVLRCAVCALDRTTGVHYRAAVAFDEQFSAPEVVEESVAHDSGNRERRVAGSRR